MTKCLNEKYKGKSPFYDKLRKLIYTDSYITFKVYDKLDETLAFTNETTLIASIGRKDKNKGPLLNLTDGGEGFSGRILTEEEKYKKGSFSRNKTFEEIYGIEKSNMLKKTMAKSLNKRYKDNPLMNIGENNGMFGKHHSHETKEKLSILASIKLGSKNPNAKEIEVFDKHDNYIKTFMCLKDASNELVISSTSIGKVLNGTLTSSKGFKFKYKNKNA